MYLKTESHTFLKGFGFKNLKMSTISTININRWVSPLSNSSFLCEFMTVYVKKPIKTVKAGSRLYMGCRYLSIAPTITRGGIKQQTFEHFTHDILPSDTDKLLSMRTNKRDAIPFTTLPKHPLHSISQNANLLYKGIKKTAAIKISCSSTQNNGSCLYASV